MIRMLFLLSLVLLVTSSDTHYHHGKESDFYGEFYRDSYGKQVYTYCYEVRFSVRHRCRKPVHTRPSSRRYTPLGDYFKRYRQGVPVPYEYSSYSSYHEYDGRGNIHVGSGVFHRKGRDMVIECDFPSGKYGENYVYISNVVWNRKGYGRGDYKFSVHDYHGRFRVERFGLHGSRLIIRNYRGYDDDGVYRCFATRQLRNSYRRPGHKENIYMEVEVYEKKYRY